MMADYLDDDAEFWLPRQFLAEEDFIVHRKGVARGATCGDGRVPLVGLGYGSGSGLSSPVDSILSSLETDSDEEDPMADLSRKMADSTLDSRVRSGSPQSTLCPRWDMLSDAAAEVARLRLSGKLHVPSRGRDDGKALYGAYGRCSHIPVPLKTQISDGGFYSSHRQNPITYQQLVANQIQQLKLQQAILKQKQQQQQQRSIRASWGLNSKAVNGPYHTVKTTNGRNPDSANGGRQFPATAASAWPSMQHQTGAGMTTVFHGPPPSTKRECTGTGVFLPRHAGGPDEPPKKPACSTVLLPDKVVRALNLNLENMAAMPQLQYHINGCPDSENDCVWNLRRNRMVTSEQNWTGRRQLAQMNREVHLPQEWSY
ncbi:hypothetical protein SAY87_028080 [Trapa incisa]|uniref:Uncharacterized protein n=1 Tax=Trapa incisa TaxID=236973 RepID=A0AAN7L1E7_9MYRT|nr:hypothetical protein SAY87_028080 [Trapa incisa]